MRKRRAGLAVVSHAAPVIGQELFRQRLVQRRLVDDDQLVVGIALFEERCKCLAEHLFAPIGWDNQRDFHSVLDRNASVAAPTMPQK